MDQIQDLFQNFLGGVKSTATSLAATVEDGMHFIHFHSMALGARPEYHIGSTS